jgi:hypothetical protein
MLVASLLFFALAPGTVAGLIPFWLTGWRVDGPFLGTSLLRVAEAAMVLAGSSSTRSSSCTRSPGSGPGSGRPTRRIAGT